MQRFMKKINALSELELQEVMAAIQKRYAANFPEWDVFYLAIPKDPSQRKAEIELLLNLICKEIGWEITIHPTATTVNPAAPINASTPGQ